MEDKIIMFKALGDKNRLSILDMLSCGEMCACDLLEGLNLTQPTLSHHMKILQQAELVNGVKNGKWMHYSINREKIDELINFLNYHTNYKENCICNFKNKEEKIMDKKIDLYLLTGFLGSGKTTFLTNILKDLSEKKVGVIMNEFGRTSIDGEIIKKDGLELVEINRGSIFCSCLKLNFAQAMIELADKDLKYLFVESSGLADPSNIGEIMEGVKYAKGNVYNYKGAICIVDGVNFIEQLKDLETVERQIKHCHLAVISKVDLLDDKTLETVISKIKEINPMIPIEISNFGKLNYDFLNEDLMRYQWAENEDTTNVPENKPKTLMLTFDGNIEKENLLKFIDRIGKDSYRIKGFVNLEDGWNQIDVVGNRVDLKSIVESYDNSQLVIISKIGPQIIRPIANNWEEIFDDVKMKLR